MRIKKYPAMLLLLSIGLSPMVQAEGEKTALSEFTPVLSEDFISVLNNADPQVGQKTFMRKCSSCHDDAKDGGNGKGPHLWNVFSRKAGTYPGFEYSQAMRNSGHTWNFATINYYLTRTDRAVPGRAMNFRGIRSDNTRAALLRYLATLNDMPPALPEPR